MQEGGVLGDAAGEEEFRVLEMSDVLVILRPFGIRMEPTGPWDQLDDYAENSGDAAGVGRARRDMERVVKGIRKNTAIVNGRWDSGFGGGVLQVSGFGGGVLRVSSVEGGRGRLDDKLVTGANRFPDDTVEDVGIGEVFPFTEEGVADKIHLVCNIARNLLRRAGDWRNCRHHLWQLKESGRVWREERPREAECVREEARA